MLPSRAPTLRFFLLFGVSAAAMTAPVQGQQPSPGQQTQVPADQGATAYGEEDEIVVKGKKPRGSVIGDIKPQTVLKSRDVRATGATNFDELLVAIAPIIGAARSSGSARPLVLLNGHRVTSYRELRDIPIEAISRVDILPEEVALKYGFPPDQKVVNVVLQNHFGEWVGQIAGNTATHHGFTGGGGDLTRIALSPNQRTTINVHAGSDNILRGSQRSLVEQQYESTGTGATGLLLPPELGVRGTATIAREFAGGVEGTFNGEVEHSRGHALNGLSEQLPAELNRDSTDDNVHLGGRLSGDRAQWHWNLASNAELDHNTTTTTRSGQLFAPGSAKSTRFAANVDGTVNGPLFAMPAGNADITLRAAGSTEHLHIEEADFPGAPSDSTSRNTAIGAANLDVPLSRRGKGSALGNLTVNGNAEIDQLSDFGTLTRFGAGANWSPFDRLSLIGSWSRESEAPTVRQLGDPFVETPGTRIFDFTSGVVTRASVLTGGNTALRPDRRSTFNVSANWQPFEAVDFRLRADYARVKIDRPLSNITVFPELEAAFPQRFVRAPSGTLLSVDLRPVNFFSAHRDALRLGFDFTKPLKSKSVSQADVQRLVDKAKQAGIAVPQTTAPANAAPGTLGNIPSANGRLTFSLTDTITLVDRATIAPGLPELDYLHGAPTGQTGGQPRHQVQAQAGWANNGFGARVGANWRSATFVDTVVGDRLHFSPVATFDLTLFANVGNYLPIVSRFPWLRGASVRFEVGNIFNSVPRVRNNAGAVPIGYEPNILDPFGRTFMITFRKQFLPASYYRDQLQRFEKQQFKQP